MPKEGFPDTFTILAASGVLPETVLSGSCQLPPLPQPVFGVSLVQCRAGISGFCSVGRGVLRLRVYTQVCAMAFGGYIIRVGWRSR